MAVYQVKTEEAIQRYGSYFDMQYGRNKEFTEVIDCIYELYKQVKQFILNVRPTWCHGHIKTSKTIIKRKK